jgi:hypothetical protein
VSLLVRQAQWGGLEGFTARERRTLGNIGEDLLEPSFEHLKAGNARD